MCCWTPRRGGGWSLKYIWATCPRHRWLDRACDGTRPPGAAWDAMARCAEPGCPWRWLAGPHRPCPVHAADPDDLMARVQGLDIDPVPGGWELSRPPGVERDGGQRPGEQQARAAGPNENTPRRARRPRHGQSRVRVRDRPGQPRLSGRAL